MARACMQCRHAPDVALAHWHAAGWTGVQFANVPAEVAANNRGWTVSEGTCKAAFRCDVVTTIGKLGRT